MISSAVKLIFLGYVSNAVKVWQPSGSMDEPSNWKKWPAACDRVLLNKSEDQTTIMSQSPGFTVSSIVLPRQGVLRFPQYSALTFAGSDHCQTPGSDAEFVPKSSKNWLDPDNWMSDIMVSGGWVPHKNMIPGKGDAVVFNNSIANVELPSVLSPYASISINSTIMDADEWNNYLSSEEGYENFHGAADLRGLTWRFSDSCKCSSDYMIKDWNYMDVEPEVLYAAMCEQTASRKPDNLPCYEGVQPIGHCFPICGSVISFVQPALSGTMGEFVAVDAILIIYSLIEKALSGKSMPHYVGLTPSQDIEVVLVAPDGDSLKTAMLAQQIVDSVRKEMPKWQTQVTLKYSGLSKGYSVAGNVAALMLGTLLSILSMFAAIYYIYIVLPTNSRLGRLRQRNPFAFARFRNKLPSAASNETLAFETEPPAKSEAFVNPLFRPSQPGPRPEPSTQTKPAVPQQKEDEMGVTLMEITKTLEDRQATQVSSDETVINADIGALSFSQLEVEAVEDSDGDEEATDLREY